VEVPKIVEVENEIARNLD